MVITYNYHIKYGGLMLFANLGLVGIHVNWMGSMWGFSRIFDGGNPHVASCATGDFTNKHGAKLSGQGDT